jgi:putative spermidine/putrescine transport system ATP-binding protein
VRSASERPVSAFIARFIGGHNVLPAPHGPIAVRADRCQLGTAGDGPYVSGRVAAVEYQGTMVRVALSTDAGDEAAALVPDATFYRAPVAPGDAATLVWNPHDAHALTEA